MVAYFNESVKRPNIQDTKFNEEYSGRDRRFHKPANKNQFEYRPRCTKKANIIPDNKYDGQNQQNSDRVLQFYSYNIDQVDTKMVHQDRQPKGIEHEK